MCLVFLIALVGTVLARSDDWKPIVPDTSLTYATYVKPPDTRIMPSSHLKILNRPAHSPLGNKLSSLSHAAPTSEPDSCSVYKVSMNQEQFYQYVEYDMPIPDLKEFTLCMWVRFHNHSEDHPLFSYLVGDEPKEISAMVANTEQSSYFSMAVHGQTFFRLNYPLKINAWYHSCQSWNGKTGEWQLWVNAERVGRGFHNRLVGHIIKGGGTAVSGQEQSLLFSKDGTEPVLTQSGFTGEITMLQLYRVALTAGKAHKDHKHHHAHHFKHDGTPIETSSEEETEAPLPEATPIGNGNFLIGGQLQRAPNLNLAGAQPQMIPVQLHNGLQVQQPYVNGQLGSRIVSEQLLNSVHHIPNEPTSIKLAPVPVVLPAAVETSESFQTRPLGPSKGTTIVLSGTLLNPANVQFIDDTHNLYKRDSKKRNKRDNPEKNLDEEKSSGKKDKRGLVALSDGSVIDDALLSQMMLDDSPYDDALFQQSLSSGLAGVVGNLPIQKLQKQTVDEREPAEAEVKAVMKVCSGCTPEPFKKALILSWRTVTKKLYSGARYYKGLPICKAF